MVLLLLAATLLYALLGSVFDSVVLLLSIVAVAAIVYQELRTQRVLEALYHSTRGRVKNVFRKLDHCSGTASGMCSSWQAAPANTSRYCGT